MSAQQKKAKKAPKKALATRSALEWRKEKEAAAAAAAPEDDEADIPRASASGDKWTLADVVKIVIAEKTKTAERLVVQKKINCKLDSDLAAARSTITDLGQRVIALESWQASKEEETDTEKGMLFSMLFSLCNCLIVQRRDFQENEADQ